jgi:hypothetical protein
MGVLAPQHCELVSSVVRNLVAEDLKQLPGIQRLLRGKGGQGQPDSDEILSVCLLAVDHLTVIEGGIDETGAVDEDDLVDGVTLVVEEVLDATQQALIGQLCADLLLRLALRGVDAALAKLDGAAGRPVEDRIERAIQVPRPSTRSLLSTAQSATARIL